MNKNKILKIVDELSNNAMFAMSLTSKELFHSNIWAWMLRKYPKVFTPVFYPEYNKKDKIEVLREYKNTDLVLEYEKLIAKYIRLFKCNGYDISYFKEIIKKHT